VPFIAAPPPVEAATPGVPNPPREPGHSSASSSAPDPSRPPALRGESRKTGRAADRRGRRSVGRHVRKPKRWIRNLDGAKSYVRADPQVQGRRRGERTSSPAARLAIVYPPGGWSSGRAARRVFAKRGNAFIFLALMVAPSSVLSEGDARFQDCAQRPPGNSRSPDVEKEVRAERHSTEQQQLAHQSGPRANFQSARSPQELAEAHNRRTRKRLISKTSIERHRAGGGLALFASANHKPDKATVRRSCAE